MKSPIIAPSILSADFANLGRDIKMINDSQAIKYKQAEYLLDRIGGVFEGVVSGVTEWGLYVEIIENKCEGMIRLQSLEGRWSIDTDKYLATSDLGEQIRLGDKIQVVVKSVDLERKQVDFIKL